MLIVRESGQKKVQAPRDWQGRLHGDEHLEVEFIQGTILNEDKSALSGVDEFDPHVFVQIQVPLDKLCKHIVIADDSHKERFPREWKEFTEGEGKKINGMPLSAWGELSVSQIAQLESLGVKSVEALAALSDSRALQHQGLLAMKQAATDWLLARKEEILSSRSAETADRINKLEIEKASAEAAAAAMTDRMAQMEAMLAELTAAKKKKAPSAEEAKDASQQ